MPRLLRTTLPDGFFHVTARGVDGTLVVRDDEDARTYLSLTAAAVRRYDWSVYAFCLMTNHVHFVLESTVVRLSAGVQWLHGIYAERFNRRHERRGHLFGARFDSRVIEGAEYLASACEYVYENPVRAGLCRDPRDWPWSGISSRIPG